MPIPPTPNIPQVERAGLSPCKASGGVGLPILNSQIPFRVLADRMRGCFHGGCEKRIRVLLQQGDRIFWGERAKQGNAQRGLLPRAGVAEQAAQARMPGSSEATRPRVMRPCFSPAAKMSAAMKVFSHSRTSPAMKRKKLTR